jgi:dihydropyrimidinase
MDTVIRNGTIVTAEGSFKADIGIEGEKIVAIADKIERRSATVIDASGKLVFPGAIDVHVHFQLPFCGTVSADDFENGTKAAACGGVTSVIDFAIQKKGKPLIDAVETRKAEADGKVCVDYALHAVPTDWNDKTPKEMEKLVAGGISSFKLFMIYAREGMISDDDSLFCALETASQLGGIVGVHAESVRVLDLLVDRYHNEENMKQYRAYCRWKALHRAYVYPRGSGDYIASPQTGGQGFRRNLSPVSAS